MNQNKRDLIIIGGDLSALSCGINASLKDLDVLLLDPLEKNISNGYIDELVYKHALKKVFSNYRDYPDVFIPLARRAFWITTKDSHTGWECVKSPDESHNIGFAVDRPAFDELLADRMTKLGGEIYYGVEVKELIKDSETNAITGVRCNSEHGDIDANLVVITHRDDSSFADELIGYEKPTKGQFVLIAKETLTGDNPTPAMKLTNDDNFAASIIVLGDPLGIGFSWARLIAYRNKLIIKVYVPYDLVSEHQDHKTFVERFKMHPSIEPIVKGYESASFNSAIVQTAGFKRHPETLWGEGFIATGNAAALYHPFDCRMTDYHIYSGLIAARAAVNAKIDKRPCTPSEFPHLLRDSFLLPDRDSMMAVQMALRDRRNFASVYPDVLFSLIDGIFSMDERSKLIKKSELMYQLRSKSSAWTILDDLNAMVKLYG